MAQNFWAGWRQTWTVGMARYWFSDAQQSARFEPGTAKKLVILLETGEYTPIAREGEVPPPARHCGARILMTSERVLPTLERKGLVGHVIKLSPVRVRKADIIAQVEYYLSLLCRSRGVSKPTITPKPFADSKATTFRVTWQNCKLW